MFSNLQNTPTFHSEESWPTYKKEESALLVYLYCILFIYLPDPVMEAVGGGEMLTDPRA